LATELGKGVTRLIDFNGNEIKVTLHQNGLIFQKKHSRDKITIAWKHILKMDAVGGRMMHMKRLHVWLGVPVELNGIEQEEAKQEEKISDLKAQVKELKKQMKKMEKKIGKEQELKKEVKKLKNKLKRIRKVAE